MEKVAFQYLAFGDWNVGISICEKLLSYYSRLEGWWEFTGARINRQIATEAVSNGRGVEELEQVLLNLIKDESWEACHRVIEKINSIDGHVTIQKLSKGVVEISDFYSIDWDGSVLSFRALVNSKLHILESKISLIFTSIDGGEDFVFEGKAVFSRNFNPDLEATEAPLFDPILAKNLDRPTAGICFQFNCHSFFSGSLYKLLTLLPKKSSIEIGHIRLDFESAIHFERINFNDLLVNLIHERIKIVSKNIWNRSIVPVLFSSQRKNKTSPFLPDLIAACCFSRPLHSYVSEMLWVASSSDGLLLNEIYQKMASSYPLYSYNIKAVTSKSFK